MKYVAIQIRTGGLIAEKHSLLEFGAMVEDTKNKLSFNEIPKFHTLVEHFVYHGEAYALNINQDIFMELSLPPNKRTKKVINYDSLATSFMNWLIYYVKTRFSEFENINNVNGMMGEDSYGEPVHQNALYINVAGKNFGMFQEKFLHLIPEFKSLIRFNHRILDPSILYLNTDKDEFLPSSEKCKERADLTALSNKPDTIKDCWDTIQLFRNGLKY